MKTAKTALVIAAAAAALGSWVSEVAVPRIPRAIPTQAEMTMIRAACANELPRSSCIPQRLCRWAGISRQSTNRWAHVKGRLTVRPCTLGGHASLPGSLRVQAVLRPAQGDRRVGRGHRGGGEVAVRPRHHLVGQVGYHRLDDREGPKAHPGAGPQRG